jgi:hypothetical protein
MLNSNLPFCGFTKWEGNFLRSSKSWKTLRYSLKFGAAVAQWLRHCATNRKFAGSIPEDVIGIFHWHNPSDCTMAMGSTQPLTKMSTRSLPGGKCDRCVRLTTLPPSCAVVMKSGNLKFLETSGPLQACNGTALPYSFKYLCTGKKVKFSRYRPRWPRG